MTVPANKLKEFNFEMIIPGRLSYPHLDQAHSVQGGAPRYSASLLIPQDKDEQDAKQTAFLKKFEAVREGVAKLGKQSQIKYENTCLIRNEDKDKPQDTAEGMWILSANRKEDRGAPPVFGKSGPSKGRVEKGADDYPYAGCEVYMKVQVWPQEYGGKLRVNAELKAVMFKADGEAFGVVESESSLAEGFEDFAETGGDDVAF